MSLLKSLNQEVEDFKTKPVTIVPGYTHNQYEVINRNYHYYNSKFTGKAGTLDPTDEDGDRMYFYNIVKNPCKIFSKAIDFDTKNIRLLTTGGGDSLKTWFMERDLKYWMRDKQFGITLNRIFAELPIFGSVVLKVVDGTPHFVDLRKFVVEPNADTVNSSNFVIELHDYTVPDFRQAAKRMGWEDDKVKETIEQFREMKGTSHIRVIERYGELPDSESVDGNPDYKYKRIFIADVGVDKYDQQEQLKIYKTGVVLKEDDWTPEKTNELYWEIHAEKMPGRWLGIGVVESLYEPQIRMNENTNLQAKATYWAALRIWQTRDGGVARNLLTEVENGDILNVDSEITQVNMDERNLAVFNFVDNKSLTNRDELTFSYDAIQGERSPAGTPLGSTQISIGQTLSYFEGIQENVALAIKEMLYTVIIPRFQDESRTEHTLRLVGEDLDQYIAMVKNELVLKEVIRQVGLTGNVPTEADREFIETAITESIKQEKEKILDVPKGYYEGIKYDVDIDITGESIDTRVRNATMFAILQAIQSDPTMTQDPVKRKILFKIAEDGGVNLYDYIGAEEPDEEALPAQPGGGGVSAPDLGQQIPGQSTQTV